MKPDPGKDAGAPRFDLWFVPRRLGVADWAALDRALAASDELTRAPADLVTRVTHLDVERGARSTVELDRPLRGDDVRGAQNVLSACEAVRADHAARRRPDIPWLEQMNTRLLEGVGAGSGPRWRQHMIALGTYRAPHPQVLRSALERLLERLDVLGSDRVPAERRRALRVCRAVLAHVHLTVMHPFTEGNGRTARMLELALLLEAGVPSAGAHLLAVHYERTRSEYLDGLSRVSQSADAIPFVRYALAGLTEGLDAHVAAVRAARRAAGFAAHAREVLGASRVGVRKLALALALAERPGGVRRSDLALLKTTGITGAPPSDEAIAKDLAALKEAGLAVYEQGRWRAGFEVVPLE